MQDTSCFTMHGIQMAKVTNEQTKSKNEESNKRENGKKPSTKQLNDQGRLY